MSMKIEDMFSDFKINKCHMILVHVFERLVYNQIYDYLTNNNLLNSKQYEFMSVHSTALALGESTNHWLRVQTLAENPTKILFGMIGISHIPYCYSN